MSGSDDNTETDTTIDDETKQEDNTKQEEETEQEEEEEELIDPVGEEMEDSSTDCNCTVIVEDTSYDPEHFSSVWISNEEEGRWTIIDNGTWYWVDYSDENDFDTSTNFRGWFNKTGNNVHITPVPTDIEHSPINPDYWYKITIYGPDELYWQDYVIFKLYGGYLNEIDIELPWEPVGFTLQWTGVETLESISTNGFSQISITRPF